MTVAALETGKWDKLTGNDLTTFGGQSDQLAGLLQRKYSFAREQAEKEINEFSRDMTL